MSTRRLLEEQGRAPVLGWCDQRRKGCPVSLTKTDVKKTWQTVLKVLKEKPNEARTGLA